MGADQRIDRVDLQHAKAFDQLRDVRSLDRRRRLTPVETLGGQRQTTCLLER